MNIRNGTIEDIEQIIDLGKVMYEESLHYGKLNFDEDKVRQLLEWAIEAYEGILIVADDNGKIAGGFLGCIGPLWFSTDPVAHDMAIFLHPDYRHGGLGVKILKEAIVIAKQKGVFAFLVSNATGYESERVEKLFEFVGMKRLGGVYSMFVENE